MQKEKRNRGGQPGNKNAISHGAPAGNRNAAGHRSSVPGGNTNSVKHGLFSRRILTESDKELMKAEMHVSLTDILWNCICLQYAAIIRAQRIMFVTDPENHSKEAIMQCNGGTGTRHEYEIQFALGKQAAFLQAQSIAMNTLRTMIDLYGNLTNNSKELIELDRQFRILRMRSWIKKNTPDHDIDRGEDDFLHAIMGGGKVYDQ